MIEDYVLRGFPFPWKGLEWVIKYYDQGHVRLYTLSVALLLVRGVPALLYRPLLGSRRSAVAGLLQATSLTFIVAASQIGLELGLITKATSAALIAAGLLSVLLFPLLALTLLRRGEPISVPAKEQS